MKNLTTNQQKALNVFDQRFIQTSDWADEGWARVSTKQLIDALVNFGWNVKSAQGTIGSLCEAGMIGDEGNGNYVVWNN